MYVPGVSGKKIFKMKSEVDGILKMCAVVKLYTAKDTWAYEARGMLFLCEYAATMTKTVHYFALVDMRTDKVIWRQELTKNSELLMDEPWFFSFEGEHDIFGLSFADVCDGKSFFENTLKFVGCKKTGKTSLLKKLFSSKSKKKAKKIDSLAKKLAKESKSSAAVISSPSGFRRVTHISIKPGEGFECQNLPDEWKEIFACARISPKALRDPQKARIVMDLLEEYQAVPSTPPPPDASELTLKPSSVTPEAQDEGLLDAIRSFDGAKLKKPKYRAREVSFCGKQSLRSLTDMLRVAVRERWNGMRGDEDDGNDENDDGCWSESDAEEEAWEVSS